MAIVLSAANALQRAGFIRDTINQEYFNSRQRYSDHLLSSLIAGVDPQTGQRIATQTAGYDPVNGLTGTTTVQGGLDPVAARGRLATSLPFGEQQLRFLGEQQAETIARAGPALAAAQQGDFSALQRLSSPINGNLSGVNGDNFNFNRFAGLFGPEGAAFQFNNSLYGNLLEATVPGFSNPFRNQGVGGRTRQFNNGGLNTFLKALQAGQTQSPAPYNYGPQGNQRGSLEQFGRIVPLGTNNTSTQSARSVSSYFNPR